MSVGNAGVACTNAWMIWRTRDVARAPLNVDGPELQGTVHFPHRLLCGVRIDTLYSRLGLSLVLALLQLAPRAVGLRK